MKIHLKSFRLGIRKLLFTERVVKPCNGFPERLMPQVCWCLRGLKRYNALDKMPELLANPESVRKLDWMIVVGPLQLQSPRDESKLFLLVFRNSVYQ